MWSVPLDRCSPAYSGRDKKFQKVTNWSVLVPEISSERHNFCPFWLLHVASMQWKEWFLISVSVLWTRNSRYMTLDRWPLTSSEMSVLHASHSTLKMSPTLKKIWPGTTWTIKYRPYVCDQCLSIDALLYSPGETTYFRKSQIETLWCPKSVQSGTICDSFDYCM